MKVVTTQNGAYLADFVTELDLGIQINSAVFFQGELPSLEVTRIVSAHYLKTKNLGKLITATIQDNYTIRDLDSAETAIFEYVSGLMEAAKLQAVAIAENKQLDVLMGK